MSVWDIWKTQEKLPKPEVATLANGPMLKTATVTSKHRWYKNTKHGYARGGEPVTYVQNIRHFYSVLNWTEAAKTRTPPPQKMQQYVPQSFGKLLKHCKQTEIVACQ